MSTHASIGILDPAGSIDAITVHFDGDQVGKRLARHHATRSAAGAILELGNLASLGASLDSFPPEPAPVSVRDFIAANPDATDDQIEARNANSLRPYGEYTEAYVRDRGETMEENGASFFPSATDWMRFTHDASYHYLWVSHTPTPGWYVALFGGGKPTFVPVGQMVMVG